jgi:hypothetical protein
MIGPKTVNDVYRLKLAGQSVCSIRGSLGAKAARSDAAEEKFIKRTRLHIDSTLNLNDEDFR